MSASLLTHDRGVRTQVKETLDSVHDFLASMSITSGAMQGNTMLPLPVEPEGEAGAAVDTKDRIHLMESAVITWTKQIKDILKLVRGAAGGCGWWVRRTHARPFVVWRRAVCDVCVCLCRTPRTC